jgi:hypothetical protein
MTSAQLKTVWQQLQDFITEDEKIKHKIQMDGITNENRSTYERAQTRADAMRGIMMLLRVTPEGQQLETDENLVSLARSSRGRLRFDLLCPLCSAPLEFKLQTARVRRYICKGSESKDGLGGFVQHKWDDLWRSDPSDAHADLDFDDL